MTEKVDIKEKNIKNLDLIYHNFALQFFQGGSLLLSQPTTTRK